MNIFNPNCSKCAAIRKSILEWAIVIGLGVFLGWSAVRGLS